MLKVWSLELKIANRNFLKKNGPEWYISLSLNLPAAFSFLIELPRASTACILHEQNQTSAFESKSEDLFKNQKFWKLYFSDIQQVIPTDASVNERFCIPEELNNSFASLNPINAGPSNENAAYWLMNVVCWLAYKMVYLGKYLWVYKPQIIAAIRKISKIVCK